MKVLVCGGEWAPHGLPDEMPIRPLGARMVCTHCDHRGADVRPDWRPNLQCVSRARTPGRQARSRATEFADWLKQAEALLQNEHDARPTSVRHGVWTSLFVRNMTPADAASAAATKVINRMPASERLARKLRP